MASELRHALDIRPVRGAQVVANDLRKDFGEREVLRGVNLTLDPGEFVAVLGPSGGGKSTLLRIVAGLEHPTGGTLRFGGSIGGAGAGEEVIERRIMFQEDRLLPWKTVLDNATLGLSGRERWRALETLRAVGLEGREKDWPAVLSGGQKQRLALARALVHRPDLLLLDEPFGALDALTRAGMQRLLEGLWERERSTVLLVTHDVEEALLLADRTLILLDGRLVKETVVASPRPRHPGDPTIAARKEELLETLLNADMEGEIA